MSPCCVSFLVPVLGGSARVSCLRAVRVHRRSCSHAPRFPALQTTVTLATKLAFVAATIVASLGPVHAAFSDFVYIPGHDVTRNCDVVDATKPCEPGLCLRLGVQAVVPPPLALQTVCEGTSSICSAFHTGGCLKTLYPNSTVDSYLSNTTCGGGVAPKFVQGSAVDPSAVWMVCPNTDVPYSRLATYQLPPLLLAESCRAMSKCAGFIASADGQWGSLLAHIPHASILSFIRVDTWA